MGSRMQHTSEVRRPASRGLLSVGFAALLRARRVSLFGANLGKGRCRARFGCWAEANLLQTGFAAHAREPRKKIAGGYRACGASPPTTRHEAEFCPSANGSIPKNGLFCKGNLF